MEDYSSISIQLSKPLSSLLLKDLRCLPGLQSFEQKTNNEFIIVYDSTLIDAQDIQETIHRTGSQIVSVTDLSKAPSFLDHLLVYIQGMTCQVSFILLQQ